MIAQDRPPTRPLAPHRVYRSACPLNCWDTCTWLVEVEEGKVRRVRGDPSHPVTGGELCPKAAYQVARANSAGRIRQPLRRKGYAADRPAGAGGTDRVAGADRATWPGGPLNPGNGSWQVGWEPVSWDEALDEIARRLLEVRRLYGSLAVLHTWDFGSMGLLKGLAQRVFNSFGGVTVPAGSLCWAAGLAAQRYDFGANRAHDPADLENARLIILWGRNPAFTSHHLMRDLRQARARGAYLVTIDPVFTDTAREADEHFSPRPGSDGALALGMARVIIEQGLVDREFVADNTLGFDTFASYVREFTPARVAALTGLSELDIEYLANLYASQKPACLLLGYGLQRHANGGQTVRAIDALAALTGNLGIPGGGANYANVAAGALFGDLEGAVGTMAHRSFVRAQLAQGIIDASDPPVKALFVTRSNPVAQLPDTTKTMKALSLLDLVVTVDLTLTDTARVSDFILPCASTFEEEDVYWCSWHNYITYGERAVPPPAGVRTEAEVFIELGRRLGLSGLEGTPEEWLARAARPLKERHGLELAHLKGRSFRNPEAADVPWSTGEFATPSGKYEFYSERAARDGLPPLPVYQDEFVGKLEKATEAGTGTVAGDEAGERLRLLTPQHRLSLHSQFHEKVTRGAGLTVHLPAGYAAFRGIKEGERVLVTSDRGEVEGTAHIDESLQADTAVVYSGGSVWRGEGVNFLTPDTMTDMGLGAAYYSCLVRVEKKDRDESR